MNFFSIIYLSSNQQYSIISNINCGESYIRVFSLSNNICEKSESVEQQLLVLSNIKIKTTIPGIETTLPIIDTTLPIIKTTITTTVPKTNLITIIPGKYTTIPIKTTIIQKKYSIIPEIETTFLSTIPNIIIGATIPEKKSSLPKIDTSIIYTSIIKKNHETNFPKLITTTFSDIKTTIFDMSTLII